MKKQKTLRDVSKALEKAEEALADIERRALYESSPALKLEQRVIIAVRELENGHPLRDFLSAEEIEEAVKMLAGVLTATGVQLPPGVY